MRYLAFAGNRYYAAGGWNDYKGSYATFDEAVAAAFEYAKKENHDPDNIHDWWYQIVDTQSNEIVKEEGEPHC